MKRAFLLPWVALLAISASAEAQTLTFEGSIGEQPVANYYGGSGGPDYGIQFFGSAQALRSRHSPCNGSGNFQGQPSGCAVMYFDKGSSTGMNRSAGFVDSFSFFYASASVGSFKVYDGLDGTGTLLAALDLPVTTPTGGPCPQYYCQYFKTGLTFSGIAQSAVFFGTPGLISFDDVSFVSAVPGTAVPEPSTYLLMASGLAGIGAIARRRRRS